MPLEIRELVIKVNINERDRVSDKHLESVISDLKNKIIKDCMEKILLKIETPAER